MPAEFFPSIYLPRKRMSAALRQFLKSKNPKTPPGWTFGLNSPYQDPYGNTLPVRSSQYSVSMSQVNDEPTQVHVESARSNGQGTIRKRQNFEVDRQSRMKHKGKNKQVIDLVAEEEEEERELLKDFQWRENPEITPDGEVDISDRYQRQLKLLKKYGIEKEEPMIYAQRMDSDDNAAEPIDPEEEKRIKNEQRKAKNRERMREWREKQEREARAAEEKELRDLEALNGVDPGITWDDGSQPDPDPDESQAYEAMLEINKLLKSYDFKEGPRSKVVIFLKKVLNEPVVANYPQYKNR